MKENFIKGITLLFFISLIAGFVIYRSGFFDTKKRSVPQENEDLKDAGDSLMRFDPSEKGEMLPSSKIGIIHLPSLIKEVDSTENKKTGTGTNGLREDDFHIISGSKSGPVVNPEHIRILRADSISRDTSEINRDVEY